MTIWDMYMATIECELFCEIYLAISYLVRISVNILQWVICIEFVYYYIIEMKMIKALTVYIIIAVLALTSGKRTESLLLSG